MTGILMKDLMMLKCQKQFFFVMGVVGLMFLVIYDNPTLVFGYLTIMFSFIPLWGMSQGLQPVIGANFGAKQYGRVKDTMKIFMYGATILAAASWIPSMFCSEKLLSLFSVRREIIEVGVVNFKMFYSTFILYGIMIMTLTFFQSIGDGKKAGMIVMLRQLVLFIPAILLFPKAFGASAVWWTEPIVDFSMIMFGLFLMLNELRKMGKQQITKS